MSSATDRSRQVSGKKKRLALLRRHNPGHKFPMVEDLADELTDYFEMIGITRVVTNIYRHFYDPSNRTEDPVGFLRSLVKARKKDQRELHKAKRRWYRLLWKEWEIRDEIAKLKTLLGVLDSDMYTEGGEPKPIPESKTPQSVDSLSKKSEQPFWTVLDPKIVEHNQYANFELQVLKQHHEDQLSLLSSQQKEIVNLNTSQQQDVHILLADFDLQIKIHKNYLDTINEQTLDPSVDIQYFDVQLLQTQLGQMQTIQRKQIKSMQITHYQELLTQQNLHKHEMIQRVANEGARQQASLHNMMQAHAQHETLLLEHQDQVLEIIDEIQDHQQQSFDDSLALIENRKVNTIIEAPEQIIKRTKQQLQTLHGKQVEQVLTLQRQEFHNLGRLHKTMKKEIETQIKIVQNSLPKQVAHTNFIQHQETQIKRLDKVNDENKELVNIIIDAIKKEVFLSPEELDAPKPKLITSRSEEVLNSINQAALLTEKIIRLQQQLIHQEPSNALPKIPDDDSSFRKIQEVILQQQRRLQQQYRQQISLTSVLEHLHELVLAQKMQDQGSMNPYRESLMEIINDCEEMALKAMSICQKHHLRNKNLHDIQKEIGKYQAAYWKKRQKKDEPLDNLGKGLLRGKITKGNKKELHPLQKLIFDNQSMQKAHIVHHRQLEEALMKTQALVVTRTPIEQEIHLRRQQEKLLLNMMKETEELEDGQNEGMSALDILQNQIDDLEAVQAWMKAIIKLEAIFIDKCFEKGYINDITVEIEELEPFFQQSFAIEDESLKMVVAQQEELVASHEKIVKMLSPKQLSLTEEQIRKQRQQINSLKIDLQYFFKNFTDPFKSSKYKRESTSDSEKCHDVLDPELQELLTLLQNELTALCGVLKEKQKTHRIRMHELAQQVLVHQMKFNKLFNDHHHILAQYQDLHIEPEKQMLIDLISLHRRIAPCLKIQQQKLQILMYQLRKNQDNTVEDQKEVSSITDDDKTSEISPVRQSLTSEASAVSGRRASFIAKPILLEKERSIVSIDSSSRSVKSPSSPARKPMKPNVAERRKSVSKISLAVSELDLTEEQREIRDRLRLYEELRENNAQVLQQIQHYNKPDRFRRVQTTTQPRGIPSKRHEELENYVKEFRENMKNQPEFCPQKPCESSIVEENRKALFKLFERSEKGLIEKSDSHGTSHFLNMLKEYNNPHSKKPSSDNLIDDHAKELKKKTSKENSKSPNKKKRS